MVQKGAQSIKLLIRAPPRELNPRDCFRSFLLMETDGNQKTSLDLNIEKVKAVLVGFLRDECHHAGFARGVLGLSGGVDSAVTAYLAAEALGRENLLGVMMPYRTSSPRSRADAELVVQRLGIRSEVVDISPMVDAYVEKAAGADQLRRGNVMARSRMIVLYDISSREKALVLGTSNKTEILLGYGTLFGDTACALNPLGDLYKTQVWQLARALGVPDEIVSKKPSADLWEGQTDEGELGLAYLEVDRLLYGMVDERRSNRELVAAGFAEEFVTRVQRLIRVNQFKRRPPLIARISDRMVTIDSRTPRDRGL
jgi:NAD+ synthase